MKRKFIKITVLILFLIIALGVGIYVLGAKKNKNLFRTEKVTRGDIVAQVTATGTLNAVVTVLVGTQVSGTISHIYADYNSPVKKGQLLAQIDPSLFQAQVESARANLAQAEAAVKKAEVTLLDAKKTYERNKVLLEKGLIAQSDLDTAETNYLSAQAQLALAIAQVKQNQANLSYAETNLRNTKIISPVNGIVISRNVDVGQTVAASFQTPTLFTIAQDLRKMQIDTNIDEADIGKIKVGQQATFTVDAYPDLVFHGTVTEVRNAPITISNVVTYDVVIMVNNDDLKLKPGMTANVTITYAERKNCLRVPNAALRFRFDTPKAKEIRERLEKEGKKIGPAVWVLENKRPKRYPVKVGLSDGNFTEIISDVLREGQEVIVEYLGTEKKAASSSNPPTPRFIR
ncbi:MAG TPA: efflux RND transporter periplasmic adaptor subunit [Syntrophales bacterium]|nr:efflux RND transporter periplasmic adaptor subunit [Syntrophales bacterium]HOL59323.1 efflux RND transporter periplasmic adaptor subunit [Syntrophales bacterium]HPO35484.1 efflux RND transporter periplasmic adaptor subunit [Syntrophales bacterium]